MTSYARPERSAMNVRLRHRDGVLPHLEYGPRGAELACDGRERGQVHVDGQRPDGEAPPQAGNDDDDERGRDAEGHRTLADGRTARGEEVMDRGVGVARARAEAGRRRQREGSDRAPMQMQRRPRAPHDAGPE